MLNLKKGCKIQHPEDLHEQYEKKDHLYKSNINVEKIITFVKDFISIREGLVFFFLETPSKLDDENVIEPGVLKQTHTDVYYMDCLQKNEACVFLDRVGEILANDGLCNFGFGSQTNNDEILVGKYNIVSIYSNGGIPYDELFDKYEIPKSENIVTAWDTFSADSPGVSEKIEIDGKDVYSIIDEYKDWGMYFAEQRVDKL